MLAAEERRLYRLLALALLVATKNGNEGSPTVLLEVLCAMDGTSGARPAWVEERDRDEVDRLVDLLRTTNPSRSPQQVAA